MQLVKAIEKFPCLYNYNLPEYLKKDISEKAWHDVASQTLLSGKTFLIWQDTYYNGVCMHLAHNVPSNLTCQ